MSSHCDSHTITDVKPEIIPGIQTGNGIPHHKYNIRGISHVRTNREDDIFMQRRLYIDEAHTALYIFRFAVFSNANIKMETYQQNFPYNKSLNGVLDTE